MIPRYKAIITSLTALSPTVVDLVITRPDGLDFPEFQAGQYMTLSFPTHTRLRGPRSFSIISSPTDRSSLRFGIRIHGSYTSALRNLQPGDPVLVTGPFGQFTFDPARDRSAVFIAGGIGVTPFFSMIKTATDLKSENDLTLFYSVRSMDDAPYVSEFEAIQEANPHLRSVYAVTDGAVPQGSGNYVAGRINAGLLVQVLGNTLGSQTFFLCGPPAFMKAMIKTLQGLGVSIRSIRTERFGVGSQEFIERGTPIPMLMFATWGIMAMLVFGVVFKIERNKRALSASVPSSAVTLPAVNTNTTPNTNVNKNTNSSAVLNAPANTNTAPAQVKPAPAPTVTPTIPPVQTPIRPRTTVS
ncbi:MAG: FAD-dependent oxidoreductase [Patescibacteria group bacterium]